MKGNKKLDDGDSALSPFSGGNFTMKQKFMQALEIDTYIDYTMQDHYNNGGTYLDAYLHC